jgi:adenylate cyclase class 2
MEEIEVKFLNVDPVKLQEKLREIGAEKVGDFSYRRRVFDYPDWRLDKAGSWLRLRDEGGQVTLSFKQRLGMAEAGSGMNDLGMEETEIVVNDFVKTAQLILKLGFIEKHYAENKRTRWIKDGVEFDIDTYPELEPYLELEEPTSNNKSYSISWLGLDPANINFFASNQIYSMKGINVGDCVRLTFAEGAVKRDKAGS